MLIARATPIPRDAAGEVMPLLPLLPLIPPAAVDAWRTLSEVLEVHGAPPCGSSGHPEAWWPDLSPEGLELAETAVSACMSCPAIEECLAYALAADERFGIWGGRTEQERGWSRGRRLAS